MTNKSGFRGVTAFRGKWRATCAVGGRKTYLGLFDTAEEANAKVLAVKATLPVKPAPIAPPPAPMEMKYRPPTRPVVPRKPRFVASDLRWSHMHAIWAALEYGMPGTEAATEAGISQALWARMRSKASPLDVVALLAANDPTGVAFDVRLIGEQLHAKWKGRPATVASEEANRKRGKDRVYKPKAAAPHYEVPTYAPYLCDGSETNVKEQAPGDLLGAPLSWF